MTGIFKANNPLNAFLLFVYGLLLKIGWYLQFNPKADLKHPVFSKGPVYFFNNVLDNHSFFVFLLAYLLIYIQAITINSFIISRRMMTKPNYLPAMSYLLITSLFNEWNVISAPLIAGTLLLWSFSLMARTYNNKSGKGIIFNAGLLVGISSFVYLPAATFILLIIFSLLITRPPKVAEWLVAFLGFIIAWYFLFAWLFLSNRLYSFSLPGIRVAYPAILNNTWIYIRLIALIVLGLAGGIFIQSSAARQVVQVRKLWTLVFLYFLFGVFTTFINPGYHLEYWIIALLPLAAFIAAAFYNSGKWIALIIHWVIAGTVIYFEYFM
ncbi:MAG: hypothetical protein JSS98_14535 [Bacteroidetes bacterium]|nr:hypothetical protein [Bacteroidota bacterium]